MALSFREWKINKQGSLNFFSELSFVYSLLPTQECKCVLFYEGAINLPPHLPPSKKNPKNAKQTT